MVFNQGLGDLFVIRVAGNIVAWSGIDSVEFAAARFGTRLVVVLGHSQCGAVIATLEELQQPKDKRSRSLQAIVGRIRPSVEALLATNLRQSPPALLEQAVRANIRRRSACCGSALVAADHALLTTEAQYFALQGVEQALEVIELARDGLNPELGWLGVVFNIADMRTRHSREAFTTLREHIGAQAVRTRRCARRSPTPRRPSARSRSSTTGPTSAPTTSRSPTRSSSG